jgi:hypothetical protein
MATTNDKQDKSVEQKVEDEFMNAMNHNTLNGGWFKRNLIIYPLLFVFTFVLVVAQDAYKLIDLILSGIVLPFAMVYAVMTGKWIEDNALVIEEDGDDEFDGIQSVQTSVNKTEDTSIDRIDTFKDDKQTKDEDEEDDGFVEIDIE